MLESRRMILIGAFGFFDLFVDYTSSVIGNTKRKSRHSLSLVCVCVNVCVESITFRLSDPYGCEDRILK
jgi:hypothetical protein